MSDSSKTQKALTGPLKMWHGKLGSSEWALPAIESRCDQLARPEYADTKAHEYSEVPEVLSAKVDLLCSLLHKSKHTVVYSGAGISTSSGLHDYATKAEESLEGWERYKGVT